MKLKASERPYVYAKAPPAPTSADPLFATSRIEVPIPSENAMLALHGPGLPTGEGDPEAELTRRRPLTCPLRDAAAARAHFASASDRSTSLAKLLERLLRPGQENTRT